MKSHYQAKFSDLEGQLYVQSLSGDSDKMNRRLGFIEETETLYEQYEPKYKKDQPDKDYGTSTTFYENIEITVKGDQYFVKGTDYEETFQKIGENIIKDSKGAEYAR
ncbi:hypothetical protein SAMN04488559_11269 [Isobaculum melis]|uniref:Uncharacterized protein n=2 Tax=Isobaculum melis TaxID=142588 RepID=A0A1H9TDG5_9LACT|nr:hypothetical protein SAMN04488559_11269 [Isobaculum melis]